MTPEKTIKAFDICAAAVLKACPAAKPKEMELKHFKLGPSPFYENFQAAGHLLYMCDMGKKLVINGRVEKAMRWLGFLQGTLWGFGLESINTMKEWNR